MVLEKIRTMLKEYKDVKPEDVQLDTTLEQLQLDSLDTVQLVMDLEENFGIEIGSDTPIKTVGELVSLIESKLN